MSDKVSFRQETALGQALLHWWQNLENNRGDRAELRRAHDLTTIVLTSAYQHLYRALLSYGWPEAEEDKPENNWRNERLAAIAGLLAHIKKLDERSLPVIMSEGERPPFSELRFRRLLESSSLDEVFSGLRRALPLVAYQANVLELANDVLFWGDNVKKRWAYTYRWPVKSAV